MKTNPTTPKTIDEYLACFPQEVQTLLQKIRMTIHQAAPGAEEKISYQIPTITLNGDYLIYFAGYKKTRRALSRSVRRCGIKRSAVGL
jgi:uncharacterized protein YdhG (YjbR/CyaY superfamily)